MDKQTNDRQIAELEAYAKYPKLEVLKVFQERISTTYNTYTLLLTATGYRWMGSNGTTEYSVTENGIVVGRMYHYKNRTYRIYDQELNHIGYVKLNKSGKKYDVCDLYEYRVSTNRKSLSASDEGYLYALLLLG